MLSLFTHFPRVVSVRSVVFSCFVSVFFLLSSVAQAGLVGSLVGKADVSASGAATYKIPIEMPAGVNGLQPSLSLRYNSLRGNGLLGLGWKLSGQSEITRCAANKAEDGFIAAVDFGDDRFCLDGKKLKAISGEYGAIDTEYRVETDAATKVFAQNGIVGEPSSWRVVQPNGQVFLYGSNANSKLLANGESNGTHAGKAIKWALSSIGDGFTTSSGNQIDYTYINEQAKGELRLDKIAYNGYRVSLKYEDRGDMQNVL